MTIDSQTEEQAIRDMIATWMRASLAGDHETVLSLMAEDALFMLPGQQPFGKEAFRAAAQRQQNFRIEGKSDIQEIQVLGDWAYMRNYLEVTMLPLDGSKPIRRSGHTLSILRKGIDGKWRLSRDANLMTSPA